MPNSNTPKLNDTQLVILSSASQRQDGLAVLPENVRAASVKAAVAKLTKLGFLKEVRVKHDQPLWRTDEEGKRIGLKITKAGSAAIQVEDDGTGEEEGRSRIRSGANSFWRSRKSHHHPLSPGPAEAGRDRDQARNRE
jgi:hypothetical protein